jgi:membrane protein implicated in regulation of membrane protease activity
METAQMIGEAANTINPFALSGSLWIVWFLIGIAFLWVELIHKASVGSLSIAAIITVFSSFFVSASSQLLVFCFFAAVIYMAEHVRKEHHEKLKHHYIH